MADSLADDLMCAICFEHVIDPTVTSCGHVFDLHCLRTWATSSKPAQCPTCRTPLLTDFKICIPLQRALERIAAPEFVTRQAVARQADDIAALCRSGRLDALEQLRSSEDAGVWKQRLAARTADGSTALHVAAAAGRSPAVRFLLASGADPTLLDDKGRDPLGVCADAATAQELLRAPCLLVNRSGRESLTPLPQFTLSPIDKALDQAIADGRDQVVVALLKRGGKPQPGVLPRAARRGYTRTCEALLTHYLPPMEEDAHVLRQLEIYLADDYDDPERVDPELTDPEHVVVHGFTRDQLWRTLVYLLRTFPWLRTTLNIPPEYDLWGTSWEMHVEFDRDEEALFGVAVNECPLTIWARLEGDAAVRSAAQSRRMKTLLALLNHPSRKLEDDAEVDLDETYDEDDDDESGRCPLHYVAAAGTEEAVRALLEAGATVDSEDASDSTPLLLAAQRLRHDKSARGIVKRLLDAQAEPNSADEDGCTALHHAASRLSVEVMRLLLKVPDIAINASDAAGNSPLLLACGELAYESEDPETAELRLSTVRMLLAAGADPRQTRESDLASPLIAAVCRGPHAQPLVLLLLEHGAAPCLEGLELEDMQRRSRLGLDQVCRQPLSVCIRQGDIEMAVDLCSALARVPRDPCNFLEYTVADGFAEALDRGASDSFAMAESIARCAVSDFGSAAALAALHPSRLSEGVPPVHACAMAGAESVLQLLVDAQGGDLAAVNAYDWPRARHEEGVSLTPLLHAVLGGQLQTARWLVEHGATIDKTSRVVRDDEETCEFEGFTPLHAACHLGHRDLALLLIEAKADVNKRGTWHAVKGDQVRDGRGDMSDVTPLHLAIVGNHTTLAERLLTHHGAAVSLHEGGKRRPRERPQRDDDCPYWTPRERGQDKEDLTCTLALAARNSARDGGRVLRAIAQAAQRQATLAAKVEGGSSPANPLRWLLIQPLAGPPEPPPSRSFLQRFLHPPERNPRTPEQMAELAAAGRARAADQLLLRATYDAARSASTAGLRALLPHIMCSEGGQLLLEVDDNHRHIYWQPPLEQLAPFAIEAAKDDYCTALLLAALAAGSGSVEVLGIMLRQGLQPRTTGNAELLLTAAVMHDEKAASSSGSAARFARHNAGPLLLTLVRMLKPKELSESNEQRFTPLHAAALVGSVGAIRTLGAVTWVSGNPSAGFDRPDADGFTPVQYATIGRFRVIERDAGDSGSHPCCRGFAAAHFSWIGAPASDPGRHGGAKRQCRPAASTAACSDRGEASAAVLRVLGGTGTVGYVSHGRLKGCSLLELAVLARRDKVVAELLPLQNANLGEDQALRMAFHDVANALAAIREQISCGTTHAISLNPAMDTFYHIGVQKEAHPGQLLKLAGADVEVARGIEGMLVREQKRLNRQLTAGTVGKAVRAALRGHPELQRATLKQLRLHLEAKLGDLSAWKEQIKTATTEFMLQSLNVDQSCLTSVMSYFQSCSGDCDLGSTIAQCATALGHGHHAVRQAVKFFESEGALSTIDGEHYKLQGSESSENGGAA